MSRSMTSTTLLQSVYQQDNLQQDHCAKPHHLDPRNRMVICSRPVWTPHQEQPVNNWVIPAGDVVNLLALKPGDIIICRMLSLVVDGDISLLSWARLGWL